MAPCTPAIDSSIGRVGVYNTASYPTGADLYEGKVIWDLDLNQLLVYTGTEWRIITDVDGWSTWTPVLSSTGYAIVNGTIGGLARVHPDKMWEWIIIVVWGAGTTAGAGPMTLTTPATLANVNLAGSGIGATDILAGSSSGGHMVDANTSAEYNLRLRHLSTTTQTVQALRYNGAAAGLDYVQWVNVTSTIPVAPAQFDNFRLYGRGFA